MPSSTLTLPHTEQQRSASASGTTTLTSTSVPRSAWARMRRDLVTWLVLSDITAVALPTWIAVFVGNPAAA